MRPAGTEMSWRVLKLWVDVIIYLWVFFDTGLKKIYISCFNVCLELVRGILLLVSPSEGVHLVCHPQ